MRAAIRYPLVFGAVIGGSLLFCACGIWTMLHVTVLTDCRRVQLDDIADFYRCDGGLYLVVPKTRVQVPEQGA